MSEGIDPTLAAVLPLVGVGLGAFLGGIARNALDRKTERRAEAAALRAAARIVYDDPLANRRGAQEREHPHARRRALR